MNRLQVFKNSLDVAEKFQDWLAVEVIPTIRKHGTYMIPETIEKVLKKKKEKQKVLEELIKELKEKGINIDFAKKATFLRISAKNAVERNLNIENLHKKRQQA